MKKNLVLVDLDLTMINEQYQPTLPLETIQQVAQESLDHGDKIGLISDTALSTLQHRMTEFGFWGPIISEKGALITWPIGESELTTEMAIDWIVFKRMVIKSLEKRFPEADIVEERYLTFFDSSPQERGLSSPSKVVIIINPNRNYSFSFHVRLVDGDQLIMDQLLFDIVVTAMNEIVTEEYLPHVVLDANSKYCVIIYTEKKFDKSIAILRLKQMYPSYRFVAIGDSGGDAVLKGHVDLLCAVNNATAELKGVADIISDKPITAGVLELLQIIRLQ